MTFRVVIESNDSNNKQILVVLQRLFGVVVVSVVVMKSNMYVDGGPIEKHGKRIYRLKRQWRRRRRRLQQQRRTMVVVSARALA